jgi:hypothetical protein
MIDAPTGSRADYRAAGFSPRGIRGLAIDPTHPNPERERRAVHSRRAYVMLETVIATGMLIVGLAVIGAQLQESSKAVYTMRLKTRAVMLAEMQLAQLDLGLIKLDSIDEVQEGDFGSRYPDWGWLLITEPTAIDGMYRLTVEVLYKIREEEYRQDSFDYKRAEDMFTAVAFRQAPKPLDLAADFGMRDEELADFADKVSQAGVPCFDGGMFDPTCPLGIPIEDLPKILAALKELGVDLGDIESLIPPDLLESLQQSGLLDGEDSGAGAGDGQGPEGQP